METEKALLAIRRDSKGRIFSHIRQTWRVETPEELVRQEYVCALVNEYGHKLEQMAGEMTPPGVRGEIPRPPKAGFRPHDAEQSRLAGLARAGVHAGVRRARFT